MSLKVWLPLNGTLENLGLGGGIAESASTISWTNGKIGLCPTPSSNIISLSEPFSGAFLNTCTYSFCYWAKFDTSAVGLHTICTFSYTKFPNSSYEFASSVAPSDINGNVAEFARGSRHHLMEWQIPAFTLNDNQWHHICITVDKNDTELIYIDGVYALRWTGGLIGTSMNDLITPIDNNATLYFNVLLNDAVNDVRFYDHCLSAKEVKEISKGLILHYKLDEDVCQNLLTGETSITMTIANNNNYIYSSYIYIDPIIKNNQIFQAGTPYTITYDYTINSITSSTSIFVFSQLNGERCSSQISQTWMRNGATGTGHVKETFNVTEYQANYTNTFRIRFRISSGTVGDSITLSNIKLYLGHQNEELSSISDTSGFKHNGEVLNGPLSPSTNTPRYRSCVHLAATNQKIKISNFPTSGFGNSYSFTWWAKISSKDPMHWGFADGIRLNGMYTGRLWNTGDSSNNPLYNPGTTTQVTAPTVNVWHHWVMTGNGTKCYVYQDGQLWGEAKTYKAISGSTIYINGWNDTTSYSSNNYSVSDFRIYCTALSADDIKSLYEASMEIDKSGNILPRMLT